MKKKLKLNNIIVISDLNSISPLGCRKNDIINAYINNKSKISYSNTLNNKPVGIINDSESLKTIDFFLKDKHLKKIDRTALLAIISSHNIINSLKSNKNIGVNIGSSRGATTIFENIHKEFIIKGHSSIPVNTSPLTTLGNISSEVANYFSINSINISHSVTCSTGLQALLNSIAYIKAGYTKKMLCGASEAANTDFVIAQMDALKIYSKDTSSQYPCRPFNIENLNTFVLGEAAVSLIIEPLKNSSNPLAIIESIGFAHVKPNSLTGIDPKGTAIQQAMKMAIKNSITEAPIDIILMHAPGTYNGDTAEYNAIIETFGNNHPHLFSNKWLMGHTFAASGLLNVELAILLLHNNIFLSLPYPNKINSSFQKNGKKIMINATGFGGNAISVIISSINLF